MNFEVVAPSPPSRPMYDEWQMMNAAEICGHRDFISISQFVNGKAEKFFDRFLLLLAPGGFCSLLHPRFFSIINFFSLFLASPKSQGHIYHVLIKENARRLPVFNFAPSKLCNFGRGRS
jgi:hypothetical protein